MTAAAPTIVSAPRLKVNCPGCAHAHGWSPARAGRRARCRCGEVLRFPLSPPIAPDLDGLDLLPPPPEAKTSRGFAAPRRRRSERFPAGAKTYREPLRMRSRERAAKRAEGQDTRALALLGVGVVAYLAIELYAASALEMPAYGLKMALASVSLTLVIGTGISLVAAIVVGSFLFRTSFGTLGTSAKKFGAIAVLSNALALLVGVGMLSGGAGIAALLGYLATGWIVYFGLLMSLFDLKFQEAFVFALASKIVDVVAAHALAYGALGLFLIRAL